jgi:hypothetical protein
MPAKSLKLESYGVVMINPISIKDKELETVAPTGDAVERSMEGTRARTVYKTAEGVEIPSSQLCKKMDVEGEEIIVPKFQPSKEIPKDNITEIEDNSIMYRALDRKFYNVVTDNAELKDLVINQNKSLEFPFVGGLGWKMWKAVLTNWNGKLMLIACRGDIAKELEKYDEDTVSLELEIVPKQQNMKKLVKAMAMID